MTASPLTAPVESDAPGAARYWNPYIAGTGLGLTLLASYVVLGTGLGASATPARLSAVAAHVVAPAAVEANAYIGGWFDGGSPLSNYLVFMSLGVLVGGFISAHLARRTKLSIERGPTSTVALRLTLAAVGGGLVGFASRLAAGCTSGQALSGGAMMFTGSWAFMIAIFVGAFGAAHLVRKEWS
jgi:uncharacterized membrane protein YedE/YeeE